MPGNGEKWTMDNGQWTMDNGGCAAWRRDVAVFELSISHVLQMARHSSSES
jgi:hypothetical protein